MCGTFGHGFGHSHHFGHNQQLGFGLHLGFSIGFGHLGCGSDWFGHGHWNYDSDSAIYTGETNTNGSGSATDLNGDNASDVLLGEGQVLNDGLILSHIDCGNGTSATYASIDEWNATGYKEISVNNNDDVVVVNNFVDVDINNGGHGSYILVNDAKRGEITTGNGNDDISIDVYSNDEGWVNSFSIDSGAGRDTITMSDSQNSQFTSFDIEAGKGNDIVDVAGLNAPDTDDVIRTVDGGRGRDTLVFSGEDTVTFENFEVIKGEGDAALTIDSTLLADNDSAFSLVISDVDLSFDDSITNYEVDDLSWCESHYLAKIGLDAHDYAAVTVTTDEGCYEILTNDHMC